MSQFQLWIWMSGCGGIPTLVLVSNGILHLKALFDVGTEGLCRVATIDEAQDFSGFSLTGTVSG
jgi:hypothetical protein